MDQLVLIHCYTINENGIENDCAFSNTSGDNLGPLHIKNNFHRNNHELHTIQIQALFYSNFDIVLLILSACNRGTQKT